MQNRRMDSNQNPKSSAKGFGDLPAELRNQIYKYRTLYHNDNGGRKIFTVNAYQMRYQTFLPLLCTSSQIARDLKPVILGSHTLHLKACRSFGSEFFRDDRWNRISYAHIILPPGQHDGNRMRDCIYMEVPPMKLRPFFERLKITLQAPMEVKEDVGKRLGRKLQAPERAWNVREIDWLYPVRELKNIGFEGVGELEIEIKYCSPDGYFRSVGDVTDMETWTRSCIDGMQICAQRYKVVFKECDDGRL